MVWRERAEAARAALVTQYWDDRSGLFRTTPGVWPWVRWRLGIGPWHYWWQAHGLHALLDGVQAGDPGARGRAVRLLDGIAARTPGGLTANEYVDDLAWLGLASLRAHRLGLAHAAVPLAVADAVRRGHDPELGGFRWRFGDDYHNVPATAPAAMLMAGTSSLAGDRTRGELARRTADWLHVHVVDPTGLVWDGCRPLEGVLVPEGRLWSYNVGTVAGLDAVLARGAEPSEASARLARAGRVLRAGTAALRAGAADVPGARALVGAGVPAGPDRHAAWRDEHGDGVGADPQLFRGILAHHVATIALADAAGSADLVRDLLTQATAAWRARDAGARIGSGWAGPSPASRPSLAAHLSGTLTLGAVARLEAAGMTPGASG